MYSPPAPPPKARRARAHTPHGTRDVLRLFKLAFQTAAFKFNPLSFLLIPISTFIYQRLPPWGRAVCLYFLQGSRVPFFSPSPTPTSLQGKGLYENNRQPLSQGAGARPDARPGGSRATSRWRIDVPSG